MGEDLSALHPPHPHMGHSKGDGFIIEELDFDEGQAAAFLLLKNDHKELMKEHMDEKKMLKEELFSLIGTDADEPLIDSLSDEIGILESEMSASVYDHFSDVRQLCNADQQVIFDELIGEITKKFIGPPGPPMGPPPPGGHPPHH